MGDKKCHYFKRHLYLHVNLTVPVLFFPLNSSSFNVGLFLVCDSVTILPSLLKASSLFPYVLFQIEWVEGERVKEKGLYTYGRTREVMSARKKKDACICLAGCFKEIYIILENYDERDH